MIAHPVENLFNLFLTEWSEYTCSPRFTKQHEMFYFEMSTETFEKLIRLPLNLTIKGVPLTMSRAKPRLIKDKIVLGDISLAYLYFVPIAREDSLPKGKAVLRKSTQLT